MSATQTTWFLTTVFLAVAMMLAAPVRAADWQQVQKLKLQYVQLAAQHAMEQQRTTEAQPVPIRTGDWASSGPVEAAGTLEGGFRIGVTAPPAAREGGAPGVRFRLDKPMDMIASHSGLAFTVRTEPNSSPEVRVGCRLTGADGSVAEITPIVPVVNPWGDNPHEVYLDWSLLNYADVEKAVATLKGVKFVDITFGSSKRAPQRGPSEGPRPAGLTVTDLRLVDYLKGSYDPSRQWRKFDEAAGKWVPAGKDLTLQHRCQEVTGLVCRYGGPAGVRSAIDALDMAVRTQCWDGSFLDGRRGARTVASGEYTFGFTIYGLLTGYTALEQANHPALDEKLAVGPVTTTRREFYQRMFFRAAMARTAALPADYRDDIIGGNTLMTGANRVLGYAVAMRMVAEVLTDPDRKNLLMAKYQPYMQQIADEQGKFSGGFPLLGEGDRFGGKGIHYDSGYTRTHMDWLIVGVRQTGDPLLVRMLQRYQTVFEAVMDSAGSGLLPLISERHQGTESARLILPDATYQEGVKHKLPIIAQWGYNCGMPIWENWEKRPGNHFTFASHVRGYQLGAHVGRLIDDMQAEPKPKDLGYLFPRQFPVWSSRLHTKDGRLARTSRMTFHPDGSITTDFRIEVGEYPVTVGVPVMVSSSRGKVSAVAEKLSGWPKLLPEDAAVEITGDVTAKGKLGTPIPLTLQKQTRLVITGPEVALPPEAGGEKLPFRAELTLEPEAPGLPVEVTVLRGTVPYEVKSSSP